MLIVEHLRIRPGKGELGRVYQSRKPVVGDSAIEGPRRLRYRTDSYMVLPVMAGSNRLAVVALTDRSDGHPFDARDFAAVRVLASTAAPAFTRERLRTRLAELTQLATVDVLSGLFNRRYFETRLVDQHFEQVDLRQVPRPVRQRHEGDRVPHRPRPERSGVELSKPAGEPS